MMSAYLPVDSDQSIVLNGSVRDGIVHYVNLDTPGGIVSLHIYRSGTAPARSFANAILAACDTLDGAE